MLVGVSGLLPPAGKDSVPPMSVVLAKGEASPREPIEDWLGLAPRTAAFPMTSEDRNEYRMVDLRRTFGACFAFFAAASSAPAEAFGSRCLRSRRRSRRRSFRAARRASAFSSSTLAKASMVCSGSL